MQVETYEEIEQEVDEVESQEAMDLLLEMGLKTQLSRLKPQDDGITRIPFREAREDELFGLKHICPVECDVSHYCQSMIPLRVLKILKLALETDYFDKVVVWDKESAEVKDPVLLGIREFGYYDEYDKRVAKNMTDLREKFPDENERKKYTQRGERAYLLARWGEELTNISALIEQACAATKERVIKKLRKELRDWEEKDNHEVVGTRTHITLWF